MLRFTARKITPVLLAVFWGEDFESWEVNGAFAVDRNGTVTGVGNCVDLMAEQIEQLRRKAAGDGADITAREFLLTTPLETIATLEFG